jgi:outer membrane protein OmpA-like peptidoglycan-associated protein
MTRSKLLSVAGLSAALLGVAAPASAQTETDGVSLNQLDPAPAGDRGFGVQNPDARGEALFRMMLLLDYAHDPLVLRSVEDDEEIEDGDVVGDQFWVHLNASFALIDRFLFSLDLPIALIQAGDDPQVGATQFQSPDGTQLGDLRLGARARLLGEPDRGLQLGLGLHLWLPTGAQDAYVSDEGVRGSPFVVFGGAEDRIAWSAQLGMLFRPGKQLFPGEAPVGNAVTFGAGVFFMLDEERTVQVGPELYGSTVVSEGGSAFAGDSTNVEVLGSVRWRPGGGDFVVGLGAGPGFGRGVGTPDYRIVAMVGFLPETDSSRKDRDEDGVPDEQDACPDDPGVKTPDPQTNGCPAPPGDQDADGVKDEVDKCPTEWGEKDNQGCPKDKDKDGVPDYEDACPDEAGIRHEEPRHNGCPRARIIEEESAIIITEKIEFDHGKATIKPESDGLIQDVADILKEHPEIEEIEIQGHTDNTGPANVNRRLSDQRAQSVRKALIDKGVEKKRLRAKGYGPDKPIADNDSDGGRANNRRVEFKIRKGPGADVEGK